MLACRRVPGKLPAARILQSIFMIILVVEDDPIVLIVFESMLKSKGHEVIAAPDTATANRLLGELGKVPDVLLVDVVLIGESGIDYASVMRVRYPSMPIVFTTGYPHREGPALHAGMGEVLRKPFRPQELFDTIERASRNRQAP